ncbi:hypothetical protein D2V17_14290 [Aurantiacibacter xanthus]|uniref:DUF2730 family protein n=1 Tax=Aurantiacibacter xanthus TaxID=1784712 RepID=A0A3A1P384_9SPHN|nr:hypothetical protein [Aurantiacibacter xanthus]RIV82968.1 hypothetical protein D2V17_14290 [Aurantiacibacter xanthus]
MSEWLQIAIIAFILLGIGVAIRRGGAANPVGTGELQREVASMRGQVTSIKNRVTEIEHRSASKVDIERLEDQLKIHDTKVSKLGEAVASQQPMIQHTSRQVDRLYDAIVKKGMDV